MRKSSLSGGLVGLMFVLFGYAAPAQANFHLWKIDQIFSSQDGTQQYIEMSNSSDGEQFPHSDEGGPFGPAMLISGSKTFVFPNDLPLPNVVGHDTAGQHMLLATSGFHPNGLIPDYTLPANFFALPADSIKFTPNDGTTVLDSISYTSLPFGPDEALYQEAGTTNQSVDTPLAHNFTGQKVTAVPIPSAVWMGMIGLALGAIAHRRFNVRAA